jgi:hypothetical protein
MQKTRIRKSIAFKKAKDKNSVVTQSIRRGEASLNVHANALQTTLLGSHGLNFKIKNASVGKYYRLLA